MLKEDKLARFERLVLPHLDGAFNLARWLTGNEADADDVVQEAFLRAYKGFDRFSGGNAAAWILTVVRNTCYSWLKKQRGGAATAPFDESLHGAEGSLARTLTSKLGAPEANAVQGSTIAAIRGALQRLPIDYREAIVLREFEELSYREIAEVTGVPVGTVMSRLARARRRLQQLLIAGHGREEWQ